jgi:septum formation protein
MTSINHKILLASSSSYRQLLLGKLIRNFSTDSPNINEIRLKNESFKNMAERLAKEKSLALASKYPDYLIIGSDQVACIQINKQEIQLQKPITKEKCFEQLKICQGQTVKFYTGICLLNTLTLHSQTSTEYYETKFRKLNDTQIWNYIEREPALDCAGGFKMEGLGIALFEHIRGDDPNSLIGLPLIKLIDMLHKEGVDILG